MPRCSDFASHSFSWCPLSPTFSVFKGLPEGRRVCLWCDGCGATASGEDHRRRVSVTTAVNGSTRETLGPRQIALVISYVSRLPYEINSGILEATPSPPQAHHRPPPQAPDRGRGRGANPWTTCASTPAQLLTFRDCSCVFAHPTVGPLQGFGCRKLPENLPENVLGGCVAPTAAGLALRTHTMDKENWCRPP